MDTREISKRLLYYKKKDIREAIVESADSREVGIRFWKGGFGKRPDVLMHSGDVLELIKKGVSSFHISEEKWEDPLLLSTSMAKHEINKLRTGWDLVLDIDFPVWEFSKLTADFFIRALKDHGVNSISCKYSGNKGFHIGVPFSSFPKKVGSIKIKNWFPEGPRRITQYLLDYIVKVSGEMIKEKDGKIIFDNRYEYSINDLSKTLGVNPKDLTYKSECVRCGNKKQGEKGIESEFICPNCRSREISENNEKFRVCQKCKVLMKKYLHSNMKCEKCGSKDFKEITKFNPFSVIQIDTLLISSRHLFRSPYSLHEKSGLVSLPINPEKVMSFSKEMAAPEKVSADKKFIFLGDEKDNTNKAKNLVLRAMDYKPDISAAHEKFDRREQYDIPEEAISEKFFPPCIIKILNGMEDGRKRALFALFNFLNCAGWNKKAIAEKINKWNNNNTEKLRVNYINSHINYHSKRSEKFPPPNCKEFYQDMQVCFPDRICKRIKNPVAYPKIKIKFQKSKKKRSKK
ncbi:hypothetical protein GF327_09945 [Candidatus Woesearchaeota archaeon]|nr:hypothetical protein [Candidatus Woesearchaeota archaeon]